MGYTTFNLTGGEDGIDHFTNLLHGIKVTHLSVVGHEIDGDFGAAAGKCKILTVDRSSAENFPSAHRRHLASLFGTGLKRKQGSAQQRR